MVADLICCSGHKCNLRVSCARHLAYVPDDHPVFWLDPVPVTLSAHGFAQECDHLIPLPSEGHNLVTAQQCAA